MKLRTKVFLAILATWAILFLVTYISAYYFLSNYYLKLESEFTKENMNRVYQAMSEMEEGIANVASGWSLWDDAYQFARDRNEAFIKKALSIPVVASSDIDIALVYNQKGSLIYAIAVNKERTQKVPVPEALKKALSPQGSLWSALSKPSLEKHNKGIFKTSEGFLILAIYPILPSDGKGTPSGSWVLAKYWTPKVTQQLKEITRLNFSIYALDQLEQKPNLKYIYKKLSEKNVFLTKYQDDDLLAYSFLKDIHHQPLALIETPLPRSIYLSGLHTIQYFFITFLLSAIAVGLLLFYLLRRLVIQPLEDIHKKFSEIEKHRLFSIRFKEKGVFETAYLSSVANKMLDAIGKYEKENQILICNLNEEFHHAQLFSKRLEATWAGLQDIIDSMPSILIILNRQMQIESLNQVAKNLFQVAGFLENKKSLFELLPYLKPYETSIEKSIKSQTIFSIKKNFEITPPEKNICKNVLVFPLKIQHAVEAAVIRIDDITEQIQLEQKMAQSEKMASLGLLTTGVAHEINNPINFILASVPPLQRNLDELLTLLNQYHHLQSSQAIGESLQKLEAKKEEIDLNYLLQETLELLDSIQDGVERTVTIIKDLRTFSRIEENNKKPANLEEGIESTLSLLRHNYKDRIQIKKMYSHIPLIYCFPGKLNQVFMNLLANAIDAITDQGEIEIQTRQIDPNHVEIRISDNGGGISPETQAHIFEPFFTTKPVGKGTGLGLSVSKEIIVNHHGTIEVKSDPNKGTEFIIQLPING